MVNFRIERLNKEFKREIARLLQVSVKNVTARKAVITKVDCTKDLKEAVVYFTLLDREEREKVEEALLRVAPYIRKELGKHMRIKVVPKFSFKYDSHKEDVERIERVLDLISDKRREETNE